jgi:phospholipid transport system substrate-binding protein
MNKIMISAVSVMFLSLLFIFPAASTAATPTETVKTTVDKVIQALNDPSLKGPAKEKERRARIRAAVLNVFDFNEMAKRSLGQYWKDRTESERAKFVELFSDLLERSYINRIESYSGEKIVYEKETLEDDYAVVKTRFITKRREEIPVNYKLIKEDGNWGVYDLVIENVSLVNNYRTQFNKIIRTSSYQELVRKMQNKSESESFVSPGKK